MLHGLGRTQLSMARLASALRADGYVVVNGSYPTRAKPVEELTAVVASGIDTCRRADASKIHFVTHSAGAIVLRYYFQSNSVPEAQRAVMLGPPNHGSEIVDRYRHHWWFRAATGPLGQQLGTNAESLPNTLWPIPLEIGVVAGTKTLNPWFSKVIPGRDDGKVSTASAALPEMVDYLLVPHTHTFMSYSNEVARQVKAFLRQGSFARGE